MINFASSYILAVVKVCQICSTLSYHHPAKGRDHCHLIASLQGPPIIPIKVMPHCHTLDPYYLRKKTFFNDYPGSSGQDNRFLKAIFIHNLG